MSAIVKFNNLDLEISEYRDTWSLSDRQVAQAYGVTQEAVRKQRTQGATEYVEGVHYYLKDVYHDGKGGVIDAPVPNPHGGADTPPDLSGVYPTPQKMVFWTKKGVITLGFKLTETPQTISFRDWASDFILSAKAPSIQDVLADPRAAADILLRLADTQDEVKRLEPTTSSFQKNLKRCPKFKLTPSLITWAGNKMRLLLPSRSFTSCLCEAVKAKAAPRIAKS